MPTHIEDGYAFIADTIIGSALTHPSRNDKRPLTDAAAFCTLDAHSHRARPKIFSRKLRLPSSYLGRAVHGNWRDITKSLKPD